MANRPSSARPMTSMGRQPSNARPPSSSGRQQMIVSRPASSMGRTAGTTERPPTTSSRPAPSARPSSTMQSVGGAAARPSTGANRGRLGTAAQARPGSSRVGVPNVTQRPVTQQGLQGVRPSTRGGMASRQVQDKSYYMGLLRAKMTELNTESSRLRKEMDHYDKERQNFNIYENKAEQLASEIKELQGQLADFNTLVDKLNTNSNVEDMRDEYEHLRNQNDVESQSLDHLFSERKRKEEEVKALESQLAEEKAQAASVLTEMDPGLKNKYETLKEENTQLVEELTLQQQELESLNSKKDELEQELAVNQLKREAMMLYEKQSDLEAKRDAIVAEMNAEGTPEQQRERLLDRVKKDNEEIASMERQTSEIRERIEQIHEEMHELEEEMEDQQSEKNQKYRELRQKEMQMDEFLETYEQAKATEQKRVQSYQKNIVKCLELMSKALQQTGATTAEATEKSEQKKLTTPAELAEECQRLQNEVQRLDELEETSKDELKTIKGKMNVIQQEIEVFSDLKKLEYDVDQKKTNLMREREELSDKLRGSRENGSSLQQEVEQIKSELNENDNHLQLMNLEKKLQYVEQNNFALKDIVDGRQAETNVGPIKENVLSMIAEYNQMLVQSVTKLNPRVGSS